MTNNNNDKKRVSIDIASFLCLLQSVNEAGAQGVPYRDDIDKYLRGSKSMHDVIEDTREKNDDKKNEKVRRTNEPVEREAIRVLIRSGLNQDELMHLKKVEKEVGSILHKHGYEYVNVGDDTRGQYIISIPSKRKAKRKRKGRGKGKQ